MVIKIIQKENKVLREPTKEVLLKDIESSKIKKIIADMREAMHGESDAVAIAAPQIGIALKIFVVSGKIFAKKISDKKEIMAKDQVFINPKILKLSKETRKMEEGCLSVRYLYGKVKRSVKASLEAYDEKGKKIKRGASGLLAQIFQHETDHLKGVLFSDKAEELVSLPPEEIQKIKNGSSSK